MAQSKHLALCVSFVHYFLAVPPLTEAVSLLPNGASLTWPKPASPRLEADASSSTESRPRDGPKQKPPREPMFRHRGSQQHTLAFS
ncbi:hypothetical protein E2C01_095623 [Portunus trituberculatus]|uniref:Secreted protein n=1 Tax=Portunus trituberculatus TaxID=210409 RepID=A0A5B7K0T9_PORTR|nr:hypothetical protein [Portunus trituberculatus]